MMRAQLLLFAFGLFVWLLIVSLTAWRKRRRRAAPRQDGPHVPPVLPRARPLPPPRVTAPRGASVPAGGRVTPSSSARRRTGSRLREVRRGIVLMTILGPCRSLERPEPPW